MRGEVEFDDVSFGYATDDGKAVPAVRNLSFRAKPGSTIALVGPTGAGKTTALSLLYRAYDPQSGSIRIDGRDLRELDLDALRRNIGVVFQEPGLFYRSIGDNLRVANPHATPAQVEAAARAAEGACVHQSQSPRATTRSWLSAAARCPAVNASGSRLRAPC